MERILHLMLASACLISVHLNRTGSGTGKFVGVKGQHFMIDGNPIILWVQICGTVQIPGHRVQAASGNG
jgi:hypothetical protein